MRRSSSSSSFRKRPSKFPKDSFPQTIGNFEVTVIDNIHSRFLYTENLGIECWGPDSVEKIVTDILGIYDSRGHPLIDKVKFYTSASGPAKGQRYFVQRKPEDAVLFAFRMLKHDRENIRLFVSANDNPCLGYPYEKHTVCCCKMTMKVNPLCEGCRGLDPKLSTVKCASMDYRDITCTRFTQIKDSYILGEHPPRLRRFACEGCRDFSDEEEEEMEEEEREPYERLTKRKYWCGGCRAYLLLERSDFKPSKWEHDNYLHLCRECRDDIIEINEEDLPV